MNIYKKQLLAAISSAAMMVSLVSPVAAQTIEISDNGASSDNTADVTSQVTTAVVQTNVATVTNSVDSSASTGSNDANQNTGGDTAIRTGNADTSATVVNDLNLNQATVDCCEAQETDVLIEGNGVYSENEVELENTRDISVYQTNVADVSNDVDAQASTGYNDANQNTGGQVLVSTGDASTDVEVSTAANANWARVGGGSSDPSSLSARILGNGAYSDNDIDLDNIVTTALVQTNTADVRNDVDASAKTGYNDANQNTNGDVLILTGNADASVVVDNLVNFNWASIDCGCLTDLSAKISGNGVYAEDEIEAELQDDRQVFQTSVADLYNDVDAKAKTGKNDADQNTGKTEGIDPVTIWTGDSNSSTTVENTGNANTFGGFLPEEWPEFDFSFNLSLDWGQLQHLLALI